MQSQRVCPFDPKHLVRSERYEYHLLHCDKRPECHPSFGAPYYEQGCFNRGTELPDRPEIRTKLQELTEEELGELFFLVERVFAILSEKHPELVLLFSAPPQVLEADIDVAGFVSTQDRHAVQIKSQILHTLRFHPILAERLQYSEGIARLDEFPVHAAALAEDLRRADFQMIIEAGSGTGELSAFLAAYLNHGAVGVEESRAPGKQLTECNEERKKTARNGLGMIQLPVTPVCYLMVEREMGYKIKYDHILRKEGAAVLRLVVDLRDFAP